MIDDDNRGLTAGSRRCRGSHRSTTSLVIRTTVARIVTSTLAGVSPAGFVARIASAVAVAVAVAVASAVISVFIFIFFILIVSANTAAGINIIRLVLFHGFKFRSLPT